MIQLCHVYISGFSGTIQSRRLSTTDSSVLELMAKLQADAEAREDARQQRLLEHEERMEERRQKWEEQRREREEEWRREQRQWEKSKREREEDEKRQRDAELRKEKEFAWEGKRREREVHWEGQRKEKELQWEEQRRERELSHQQQMLQMVFQTLERIFQHQRGGVAAPLTNVTAAAGGGAEATSAASSTSVTNVIEERHVGSVGVSMDVVTEPYHTVRQNKAAPSDTQHKL